MSPGPGPCPLRRGRVRERLTHRPTVHLMPRRERADRQPFISVVLADTFDISTLDLALTRTPFVIVLVDVTQRRDRQVGVGPNPPPITTATKLWVVISTPISGFVKTVERCFGSTRGRLRHDDGAQGYSADRTRHKI